MSLLGQPWPFWRRRLAHLVLLVGLALLFTSLFEAYPREQILVFHLDRNHPIRELRARWLDESGEELGGAVLHFPEGRTQPVRHPIRLKDGQYDLQIQLLYANLPESEVSSRSKTNLTRRVTLRGGETPISLSPPTPRKP